MKRHPSLARTISIRNSSQIIVNPRLRQVPKLRQLAMREHFPDNEDFPSELFDISDVAPDANKIQYTLAEFADTVSRNPLHQHVGYISVLLADIDLVGLAKKGCLFSMECCATMMFANCEHVFCDYCGEVATLYLNPNILREIVDETGSIRTDASYESAVSSTGVKSRYANSVPIQTPSLEALSPDSCNQRLPPQYPFVSLTDLLIFQPINPCDSRTPAQRSSRRSKSMEVPSRPLTRAYFRPGYV